MQVSLGEWHNPVTQAPFMPNLTHKVEMAPQIQSCVPSAPNESYKNVQTVYWSQKYAATQICLTPGCEEGLTQSR